MNLFCTYDSNCFGFVGHQALPLVSTFWGILLFGEYRKSSKKTYTLLVFMLLMFIAAVATLMASSGHRSTK
jgi:glucose uptake protein GlcU